MPDDASPRFGRVLSDYPPHPATWLIAGAAAAGVVTAADVGGSANLLVAGDGLTK